jgi:hypothetical protein
MAATKTITLEMPARENIVFLSCTLQEVQRVEAYKRKFYIYVHISFLVSFNYI